MTALWIILVLAALATLSFADTGASSLAVAAREQVEDEESDGIEPEPEGSGKKESVEDQYDHEPSDEDDEAGEEAAAPDAEKETSDESEESDETPSSQERGFDENLLALAQRFEISRENALQYSSPGDLLRTITQLNAIKQTQAKAQAAAQAQGNGPQADGRAKSPERPTPPKFEFNLKSLGLNPDNLPDEVVTAFDKLGGAFAQHMDQVHGFYGKDLDGVKSVMGELLGHFEDMRVQAQEAEQIQFADEFDGLVKELGADWEKELGKGTWRTLKDADPALMTREKVIGWMGTLREGFVRDKEPVPSNRDLMQMALRLLYPQKQAAVMTQKIRDGLKTNAAQQTRKPTPKGKSGGDPYDKAGRKIEKFQRAASSGRTTWDDGDDEV